VVIAAALVTRIGSYVCYCLGALVSLLNRLPDASHGRRNNDSRYWSWSIDVARYAHNNCLIDNLDDCLGYRVWNWSKLAVYGSPSCAGVCGVLDFSCLDYADISCSEDDMPLANGKHVLPDRFPFLTSKLQAYPFSRCNWAGTVTT
jgi:hypothetical protein